jgi:hypothetical protein
MDNLRKQADMHKRNPQMRFWRKVDTSGDCWIWTATLIPRGYGRFWLDGKQRLAHRVAYEWLIGSIPETLEIDHLCRVRACVNPDHLEPVTADENQRRARPHRKANKSPRSATTCVNGHEYTPDNIKIEPETGWRKCRTYLRAKAKRKRERRKARVTIEAA